MDDSLAGQVAEPLENVLNYVLSLASFYLFMALSKFKKYLEDVVELFAFQVFKNDIDRIIGLINTFKFADIGVI
jgi:hypothetical protein